MLIGGVFGIKSADLLFEKIHSARSEDEKADQSVNFSYESSFEKELRESGVDVSAWDTGKASDCSAMFEKIVGSFQVLNVSEDGTPIQSVCFALSGNSDYGTIVKQTGRTNADGMILFENIEKGTYVLKETTGSYDWVMDKTKHSVVINESGRVLVDGEEYTNFQIVSQRRIHGDILIRTEDAAGKGVTGAKFKLSGLSQYGNDVLVYKESDKDGNLTFTNIEKGTYELTEVLTPEGYLPCKDRFAVTIEGPKTVFCTKNGNEIKANENGQFVIKNEEAKDELDLMEFSDYMGNERKSETKEVFNLKEFSNFMENGGTFEMKEEFDLKNFQTSF